MTLKDCTKDGLVWYLTYMLSVDEERALIEIINRRWTEQEKLCHDLREKAMSAFRVCVDLAKSKPGEEMTEEERKSLIAAYDASMAADKAVRLAEKKANILYKQLNELYGIDAIK